MLNLKYIKSKSQNRIYVLSFILCIQYLLPMCNAFQPLTSISEGPLAVPVKKSGPDFSVEAFQGDSP